MRLVTIILILSLIAGSVEAAGDFGGISADSDAGAHEAHGALHAGDSGAPPEDGGKDSSHFCHCPAHAAAMSISVDLPPFARPVVVDVFLDTPLYSEAGSPPRRPPRR